jgi:hypothetical protein
MGLFGPGITPGIGDGPEQMGFDRGERFIGSSFSGLRCPPKEPAYTAYCWLLKLVVTIIRTSIGTQFNSVGVNCH